MEHAGLGHVIDLGVPSRGDHPDVRRRELGFETRRDEVGLDVVHPDPWDPARQREPLCELDPDEERSHEPRSQGDRDRVDLVDVQPCGVERLLHHAWKERDVCPRRQLGHHAAVLDMDILRRHDVREDPPVFHDRGASVIAGSFDSEDSHGGSLGP